MYMYIVHVHVCVYLLLCRVHLSMEGGSRLLQIAIKGLAPMKQQHSERLRQGGRGERGETTVARGKKRKVRSTKGEEFLGFC